MKVLSLFDGASCGMVALERAGITVDRYVAYEIDKYASQISENNYPQIERHKDVFDGDYTDYKGFNLLIGGSPCTYWSVAKTNRETTSEGLGFELFMQYARALKESEATYFLYENNFGIHKDIQTEISRVLGVEPIMINSALVSAQNRKRLYWTNIPGIKQPEDRGIVLRDIVLDHESTINEAMRGFYDEYGNTLQQKEPAMVDRCYQVGTTQEIKGFDAIKRVYSTEGKAPTLTTMQGGHREPKVAIDRYQWRKLLPIECERLQTLPDNYTAGVSKTQRHKAIGNGWTVDVIAHIFSHIPKTEVNG